MIAQHYQNIPGQDHTVRFRVEYHFLELSLDGKDNNVILLSDTGIHQLIIGK